MASRISSPFKWAALSRVFAMIPVLIVSILVLQLSPYETLMGIFAFFGVLGAVAAIVLGIVALKQGTRLEKLTTEIGNQGGRIESLSTEISSLTKNLRDNQIDEKIAMIQEYSATAKTWKSSGIIVARRGDRIISDINGLSHIGGDELRKNPQRVRDALEGLFEVMDTDAELKQQAERIKTEAKRLGFY